VIASLKDRPSRTNDATVTICGGRGRVTPGVYVTTTSHDLEIRMMLKTRRDDQQTHGPYVLFKYESKYY